MNKLNTSFWFLLLTFIGCSSLVFLIPVKAKADANERSNNAKSVTSETFKRIAYFEKNIGQTDTEVLYHYISAGYRLMLLANEAVIAIPAPRLNQTHIDNPASLKKINRNKGSKNETRIKMQFLGANKNPRIKGNGELKGKSNYFIGNDQKAWQRNVPHYEKVMYEDIYPDIDLIFYSNGNNLEHDFIVKSGADPGKIRFTFKGIDRMSVDSEGDLVLFFGEEKLRLHKPKMYQVLAGHKVAVNGNYVVHDNIIGFQVSAYDHSVPLVIDPVLSYSTFMGGAGYESGRKIAVDAGKNAYVVGVTDALSSDGTTDVFVLKLDPAGQLVYLTFIGSGWDDTGNGIAVDASGYVYLTGTTEGGFPTTPGVVQPSKLSMKAAFVTKISPSGSDLLYSTFLSGGPQPTAASYTEGLAIAIDPSGNAYITGSTSSPTFPVTPGAFQTTYGGAGDAFVAKLNNNATQLLYSTYLGGSGSDEAYSIAVDADGNAYVAGNTESVTTAGGNDFPVKNALQPVQNGLNDGFVAKLNSTGSALVFSTFLGGSDVFGGADGKDGISGLAIDNQQNVCVTGHTKSADWPGARNAPSTLIDTTGDCFVTKISPSGNAIIYSLYLGGQSFDYGTDIAADAFGNAYVIGTTFSSEFPVTVDAYRGNKPGNADFFITKIGADGVIIYSSFLGGSTNDYGYGIAVGSPTEIYITGEATSTDFPVANAVQPEKGGWFDAVIAKIDLAAPVYKLTVVKNGYDTNNNFTVRSDPPGISCGQGCSDSHPYADNSVLCNYCTHYFDAGTQVKLSAAPDLSLYVGVITTFTGNETDTVTMNQDRTVTVTFTLNPQKLTVSINGTGDGASKGGGAVTSVPAGISCPTGPCVFPFNRDSIVKLVATPDINSSFAGWSGACSNASGDCTITMNVDKSATATFKFNPVQIPGPPQRVRARWY